MLSHFYDYNVGLPTAPNEREMISNNLCILLRYSKTKGF